MSTTNDLKKIVNDNLNSLWEVSAKVLDYIYSKNDSSQQKIFSTFLKEIDASDFALSPLDDQLAKTDDNMRRLFDITKTMERILQNMINANVSETDFYEKLWAKFNDEDLFPEHEDKIVLLLSLWLNMRIPYYQLDEGCSMQDDEYKKLIQQTAPELKKARFIIFTNIQQKTQRASLLMSLADSIEDYRQRVVFWSHVISIITSKEAARKKIESLTQADDDLVEE